MIEIHYSNKKISLPENWNELTQKQFISLVKLMHAEKQNESFLLMHTLKILSKKNIISFYRLPADMRLRCFDFIKWVFEDQKILNQLIPKYKGLYGPAKLFENMNIEEFHYCEMCFHIYLEQKNINSLNDLIAILYRVPKENYNRKKNVEGDIRVPFNLYKVNFDAKKIKHWNMNVKLAILMWYASCKSELSAIYPHVFDGVKNTDNYYDGMYKMIRALSGQKYGSFKDVEKLNLHLALKEANESSWEAKELKRKYPKLYE